MIGTNIIRLCQENCDEETEVPGPWSTAFTALHTGYIGSVKATNKKSVEVKPFETITITGFARKTRNADTAVTETTVGASTRIGVCPRVVSLTKPGTTQRIPVKIFNMSAKSIHIKPQDTLCELQEVKLLRNVDPVGKTKETVIIDSQTATPQERELKCPEGIDLEDTDLTADQKQTVMKIFDKWDNIFSRGPTDIGHTNLVEHHINLDQSTAVQGTPSENSTSIVRGDTRTPERDDEYRSHPK